MSEPRKKRGRPRRFEEDAALDAALDTFWRQGYRATSLDDLVAATGASRASLYGVFGDKRALFTACLARYGDRFTARVDAALTEGADARAALAGLLSASADRLCGGVAPEGCLRCNSTLELAGTDDAIDAALDAANALFEANIARVIDHAVAAGQADARAAAALPLFYTAIVNGMVTLARGGATREDLAAVIVLAMAAWPE